MNYLLDLSGIIDLETFHEYVSKKLNFPAYYGQNFDALRDCLSDINSKTIIKIEGLAEFKKNLPDAYNKLIKCVDDYRQDYSQIQFKLINDSPSGEGILFETE